MVLESILSADACLTSLERLRTERPRIHCITNAVAVNVAANTLLALGAHPSVTHDPREVEAFTASAAALAVNIGTLDADRRDAIPKAVQAARRAGLPWVLDPVMATRSAARREMAENLIAMSPTAIRGNASEIDALGCTGSSDRVVAKTGPTDQITDGETVIRIHNGDPLMDRVTAMGCAETAMVGAFLAVAPSPLAAVAQAVLVFNIAGEMAAAKSNGPGSFQAALLDALYTISDADIQERSKVE
ncbi:hydroxyethylthiazole kinase [Hwanghaeella sp.]|uniref:hydroxyethylthiazole kinase n=1 Tax=Hwanghaeella sp. TaxID=2605943 RepID=UPI003CCC10CF